MKHMLNRPIKELIDAYPDVGRILEEYGIGCVPCSVGTCLLKDIKYHHAKEEDILFKHFDPDLDLLRVMLADHETARAHVRAVVEGVERRDAAAVKEHLLAYAELLNEHIKKEDEILYPWMDRQLSATQVDELFSRFAREDEEFGRQPRQQERFIRDLEARWDVMAGEPTKSS